MLKKNVLQYLENTVLELPNKVAFINKDKKITFKEFKDKCEIAGCGINKEIAATNKPIAVFLDKSIECLISMFGITYSGNYYTVIDSKMPVDRINNILKTLDPCMIITDTKHEEIAKEFEYNNKILKIEDLLNSKLNLDKLNLIRERQIDTDVLYVLFTSGSTGNPKGTVLTHRAVITYISWYVETFKIDQNTILGNQTPFYFSMSVSDIFSTLYSGATMCIIPKMYFSFPVKLIQYLNENKVNLIYWVPSALGIVANLGTFETIKPMFLKKVLFAGEVMPMKILNIWRKNLPDVTYANLFGPTETTDICTYYIVDRKFRNGESLPIGKACNNCGALIIKEDGTEAKINEEGELCIRGSFLANGYYKNEEKTKSVFVQNPLNKVFPEIIYKTGDIVKYNKAGELIYISRKDFQIKHMGYRIELGEIETAAYAIDYMLLCACVYNIKKSHIILFYQSNKLTIDDILNELKKKVPNYMIPNEVIKIDRMPINANGKIDRKKLKQLSEKGE